MKAWFRTNNFDLLRLGAAFQVALLHSIEHLGVELPPLLVSLIRRIPGVPIFFFMSGFLIARSYESNPTLRDYLKNRFVRLYPALWACFFVSVLSVHLVGYFTEVGVPAKSFLAWTAAQLSFGQFYTPEFMRSYGVGSLNGSLWTIAVELQFYLLVPLLYRGLGRLEKQTFDRVLIALFLFFAVLNVLFLRVLPLDRGQLWVKLIGVSFLPWVYMFLAGVWAQRNFEALAGLLVGRRRVLFLGLAYGALSYVLVDLLGWSQPGNQVDPLCFVALALCAFASAYTLPTLSEQVIGRNDVSYGLYIYHMPVINLMVHLGFVGSAANLGFALLASLGAGTVSWLALERPCLKLKRRSLKPI